MNKVIYICLMALCLFSCGKDEMSYDGETCFGWDDFEVSELNGTDLEFDELIMNPEQLLVRDSLLITINLRTEKFFHLFNLKTKHKIGESITVGQGPEDMLGPSFIPSSDSIMVYDRSTSTVYHFTLDEFVNNPSPNPVRKYKLDMPYFFSELAQLKGGLIGMSYRPDAPCYVFDSEGKKSEDGFGFYPHGHFSYSDLEIVDAFRGMVISNGDDRVVVCHFFTDLIDIYDGEGKLLKRLHGPEHFLTRFMEFNDGVRQGSRADPNYYRVAFYGPACFEDGFCVLYDGKFVNKPGHNMLSKDLLVFTWDGKPLKHYKLNQGVSRISLDTKAHKIYGISSEPEYHIVEYFY